jgi:beta-N-acetylhexosaminidase
MTLGPLMLDIRGTTLAEDDRRRLSHPLVGGVILFTRNYENPAQLAELTAAVRALKSPALLIAVDQEGGRVQRFREGFTRLPPMGALGQRYREHPHRAVQLARQVGYVMAAELRAHGIDLSFAPVLDLDYGVSSVIGDRAFDQDPQAVIELSHALVLGMKDAGMAACGKHFPGHGYIAADSHAAVPVDERDYADIALGDLLPFKALIDMGLPAIMPAHVIYPRVDASPAGFSRRWLQQVLRAELNFQGMIFSDDLTMEGASVAGDITARTLAALQAGCDMALICNRPELADEVLARLRFDWSAASRARLARLHGAPHPATLTTLLEQPDYVRARHAIASLGLESANLALGDDPTQGHGSC